MEPALRKAIAAMHGAKPFLAVGHPIPTQPQVQLLHSLQKECAALQAKTDEMLSALKRANLWDVNVDLVIRMVSGERIEVSVRPHASVALIKRRIEEQRGIPSTDQVLCLQDGDGTPLGNSMTVAQANLVPGSEIQLIIDINGSFDPRVFLMEPPRQRDVVKCYIQRKKATNKLVASEYYLYAEENAGEFKKGQLMMVAKKISWGKTCAFHISMNADELSSTDTNFLGDVQSNFIGTEWALRGRVVCQADEREDLGVVLYDTNVLGSKGPRCMRVFIPLVDEVKQPEEEGKAAEQQAGEEETEESKDVEEEETKKNDDVSKPRIQSKRRAWVPKKSNGEDGMLAKVRAEPDSRDIKDMGCYINKPPRWNDNVGAYVLNFHGRVTKASVKNFQLVTHENAAGLDDIALMFGRRGDNEFAMDYRWPVSAFQAFAVAISSCNSKLACE
eukprot:g1138.t1